jgi:hypothetical protein
LVKIVVESSVSVLACCALAGTARLGLLKANLEKKGLSPRSSKKLGLWMRNFFISKSRLITHSSSNLETLGTHRASFLIGSVRIEDLTDIQDIFSSLSCCQDIVFFRCAGCSFDEIFERFFRRFF